MMTRNIRISAAAALAFGLIFAAGNASAQALLKSREWTNADGKKLNAELLVFGKEADEGIVRLRMKDGVVHKIEEASLSREDRAVILKERFKTQFRTEFNSNLNAHFYYPKLISANSEDATSAYIGNDEKGGWLRARVNLNAGVSNGGVAMVIVGQGAEPVRLEFSDEDIETNQRSAWMDLSLTKHSKALATFLKRPEKLKFLIESDQQSFKEIPISKLELSALKQVIGAFEKLEDLSSDHVWWATFQGIDPKDPAEKLNAEEEAKKMAEKAPEVEKSKPLTGLESWEVETSGEKFDAALLRFDRQKAVFENRTVAASELIPANREKLAILRMEDRLIQRWHPVDDEFTWFWPREASCANTLLFVLERETGAPHLILQQRFETPPTIRPTGVRVRGKVLDLDLSFAVSDESRKLRSEDATTVWLPLDEEFCEVLMVATPALEGLRFEHQTADGGSKAGSFSAAEFAASLDAIEVFRLWHSLVKKQEIP